MFSGHDFINYGNAGMDDHCQNFRTLLDGWITLSSLTFIFRHHRVTVDCFYLFISYLYFILKVMFNQCFISFINSGLFYRWSCGFKSENSARKWKWHLATMKPSLPTIPVSFPNFPWRCDGHVGDRSSSLFENAAFCCMFVFIWQPTKWF